MPDPLDPQNPQGEPVISAPMTGTEGLPRKKTLEELSSQLITNNPSVTPGAIEEPQAPSDALAEYFKKVREKNAPPTKPFVTLEDLGLLYPRAVANTIQGTYNFVDDALTGQWLPDSARPGFLKAIHDATTWTGTQRTEYQIRNGKIVGADVVGSGPLGEPESKVGGVLQTLADFAYPFGLVGRGGRALEAAIPVIGDATKALGIARETEAALEASGAAYRAAKITADAKGMASAAQELVWKARFAEGRAWLSNIARMTLDGLVTDFVVTPGVRGTPAEGQRLERAAWGAVIGAPFQVGLLTLGRLIRPFIPAAERLPGYPEAGLVGYEATPTKVAEEIRGRLTPEPFVPGTKMEPAPRLMNDEEMSKVLSPKPPEVHPPHTEPTGYENVPDSLMGFGQKEPRKGYDEHNWKLELPVQVTIKRADGTDFTFIDAVKGANEKHALERARRNWPGASIAPRGDIPMSGLEEAAAAMEKVQKPPVVQTPDDILAEYLERRTAPEPSPAFPGSTTGRVNPRDLTPEQRQALGVEEGDLNFRGAIGLGRPPINMARALETASKDLPTDHIGRSMVDGLKDSMEWVAKILRVPPQLLEPAFEGTTPAEIQREIGGWAVGARRIVHGISKYMAREADAAINGGSDFELAVSHAQAGVAVRAMRALKDTLYEMGSALNNQKLAGKPLDVAGVKRLLTASADKASTSAGDAVEDARNVFLRAESKMTEAEMRGDPNALAQYIDRNGGREAMKKRILAVANLNKPGLSDVDRSQAMTAILEDISRPSFSNFAHETFVAPLFGLGTLSKVATSQFLFGSVMRPLLHSAGGLAAVNIAALTGQPVKGMYSREAVRGLLELGQLFNPSVWKMAARAGVESTGGANAGQLLREGKFADVLHAPFWTGSVSKKWAADLDLSSDNPLVHLVSGTLRAYGAGVNRAGSVLRFFPEALGTIDAIEKQIVAHQIARTHLSLEAIVDKHLPFGEVDNYVDGRIADIIKESRLRTQETVYREIVSKVAAEEAASDTPWTQGERAARVKEIGDPILKAREKDSGLIDYIKLQARDTAQDAPIPHDTPGGKLLHAAMEIPGSFLFAPVVRNAYNQARLSMQPVDAPGLVRAMIAQRFPGSFPNLEGGRNAFVREFTSNNPMMRAKALGDAMLGMSMLGGASHFALQTNDKGQPLLTGNMPADPSLAQEWRSTLHWQPRSVLVGNRYVEYGSLLGPAGTLFGLAVDAAQGLYHADEHATLKDRASMATALWSAWAIAINQNNALSDLAKPLLALTDGDSPVAKSLAAAKQAVGMLTPVPRAAMEMTRELPQQFGYGDPMAREVATLWDAVKNKIPGINSSLPLRRNDLGEPIKMPYRPFGIFPAEVSPPLSTDPVDVELRLLGRLGGLKPEHDGIDLRDVKNPQTGQSAYDRWGELLGTITSSNGMTLRDRLRQVILSSRYAKTEYPNSVDGPNLRLGFLRSVQDEYKERAMNQVMKEMIEWTQAKRDVINEKRRQAGNAVEVK